MIRVLIADDHQIVCEGLKTLLETQPDIQVVATAANGREIVRNALDLEPDVVVMDVAMPELNGMEATRQILAENPRIKVIALSMHSDRRYVHGMLAAGARGYLLKDCAFEDLARAIVAVHSNQVYLSPAIAGIVVEDFRRVPGDPADAIPLSPREREVLQLVAEGHSLREIAQTLHLSVKTVETHRRQLMEKLDIRSVAELTKYAIRQGLTGLDR